MSAPLYCPACEAPGATRTDLGFIADDGTKFGGFCLERPGPELVT